MGVRTQLELYFVDKLPNTWRIVGSAKDMAVEQPGTVLCQFLPATIKPLPQAPLGQRLIGFEMWIVVPGTEGSPDAEDALEDAVDHVLDVLDVHTSIIWDQAERGTYNGYPHATKITAAIPSERTL